MHLLGIRNSKAKIIVIKGGIIYQGISVCMLTSSRLDVAANWSYGGTNSTVPQFSTFLSI